MNDVTDTGFNTRQIGKAYGQRYGLHRQFNPEKAFDEYINMARELNDNVEIRAAFVSGFTEGFESVS